MTDADLWHCTLEDKAEMDAVLMGAVGNLRAAEDRVDELEKALRQIERHAAYFDDEIDPQLVQDIARAVLAPKEQT